MLTRFNPIALNQYCHIYVQTLCNRFFANNETISGEQILSFTPVSQVNLMVVSHLLDRWGLEMQNLRSQYFDFDHPEVQKALKGFMNIVSQHISLKRDTFEEILYVSVHQALHLLLDPQGYYNDAFRKQPNFMVSAAFMQQLQHYVRFNRFVPEHIIQKMDNMPAIEATTAIKWMEEIIEQSSDAIEPTQAWVALFSETVPLVETDIVKKIEIVTKPVVSFFETAALSIDQQAAEPAVLEAAQTIEKPAEINIAATTPAVTELVIEPAPTAKIEAELVAAPAAIEPTPIAKELLDIDTLIASIPPVTIVEPIEVPKIPTIEVPTVVAVPDQPTTMALVPEAAPMIVEAAPIALPAPTVEAIEPLAEVTLPSKVNNPRRSPIPSIVQGIPLHQKFLFIQELFGGSPAEYESVIAELDTAFDYATARDLIQFRYAIKYSWDMTSDTIGELIEVVKRRFDEP